MTRALLIILLSISAAFAQTKKPADSLENFRYDTARAIPVGTVLHYLKTNIDGTTPEYVAQYIASPTRMEAFKYHPKGTRAGYVVAEMDWQIFSAATLTSYQAFAGGENKLFGTILFDPETRRGEVSLPAVKPEKEFFEIGHFPVHLYNFDFGSLNFAFPHLKKPKKAFTVGVADPTFRPDAPLVEYRGAVAVSFVAEEKRNGQPVRKYRIDGAGLNNRGGFIWVNKKHGWIEDMEIDLPDNPDWTSFKLKLTKTEKMSAAEWKEFMAAQFGTS